MPALPFDLIDTIMDIVSNKDDQDLSSTKACSYISRDFLIVCRKHLFATIVLNDIYDNVPQSRVRFQRRATTSMLHRLLSTSPELADHIRDLHFCVTQGDLENPALVGETFKNITGLNIFSISSFVLSSAKGSFNNWDTFELRSALLHLLHLPTLVEFNIRRFEAFNLKDLTSGHIKHLGLGSLVCDSPNHLPNSSISLRGIDIQGYNSSTILYICTEKSVDGTPIFDFSRLQRVTVRPSTLNDYKESLNFISYCKHLIYGKRDCQASEAIAKHISLCNAACLVLMGRGEDLGERAKAKY
ncbi:hypothetical protein BDN70DRAFT_938818 [Pholiota conissans]|uniref:F-box domain-containing protein n=1 Tax=Pholiota conissans TaxID=109636 RepID=A0A9P5YMM6_9AGAR|nr:hypothetical protein BDN70DRAFT_938818 [Pholiota conissans]